MFFPHGRLTGRNPTSAKPGFVCLNLLAQSFQVVKPEKLGLPKKVGIRVVLRCMVGSISNSINRFNAFSFIFHWGEPWRVCRATNTAAGPNGLTPRQRPAPASSRLSHYPTHFAGSAGQWTSECDGAARVCCLQPTLHHRGVYLCDPGRGGTGVREEQRVALQWGSGICGDLLVGGQG